MTITVSLYSGCFYERLYSIKANRNSKVSQNSDSITLTDISKGYNLILKTWKTAARQGAIAWLDLIDFIIAKFFLLRNEASIYWFLLFIAQ